MKNLFRYFRYFTLAEKATVILFVLVIITFSCDIIYHLPKAIHNIIKYLL